MSDVIDDANDRAQADLDRALAAARQRIESDRKPLPVYCQNGCGEKAFERSRWCSPECRDEADMRERVLRRQGAR